MTRPLHPSLPLALASWLFAAGLQAQVDAQRLTPAVTHGGWVSAEGSAVRHPDDRWELGVGLDYARAPLIVVDGDGELVQSFVSGRLGLDARVSASLTRRLALGVALPLFVLQSGDAEPSAAGVGDLRLVPKLQLMSDLEQGLGVALLAEVRLPTHTGDFSGNEGLAVIPKVALDHRYSSGVRIGFNLGVAIRQTSRFLNVEAGSELSYAAALGYRFAGKGRGTEIGIELDGGVGLGQQDPEEVPLELLGFVLHRLSAEWEFSGGPGLGILAGYGVPTFRVFLGARYAPTRHDGDADGITDGDDECPEDAEDLDGVEDADGCPEEDSDFDHDGVSDMTDECPDGKETINGVTDDDGCPDSGDRRVLYGDGHFEVLDTIRFERGSSQLSPQSHSLLDQVALTLKANPEIEHMRVDGHTDDTGPRALNMQLSEARARAVRRYLVDKGVGASRLTVRSYGPDKPLEQGSDTAARARNRRVEFVLE